MDSLADTHCHLLAGLDDGPKTQDEALEMCRIAWSEGTRIVAATAHQNQRWSEVTPQRILSAAAALAAELKRLDAPLTIVPCAEVMISHEFQTQLTDDRLLSYGDAAKYLLIELPTGVFLDLRDTVRLVVSRGMRPILAHPERQNELLHGPGLIEELIQLGCLVQVSSDSLTGGLPPWDVRAIRQWAQRGIIHLAGSDGHNPTRRPPLLAEAFRRMSKWIGPGPASRIFCANGEAVLTGRPIRVPQPLPRKRRWFARLW